jgi:hypothetical protein
MVKVRIVKRRRKLSKKHPFSPFIKTGGKGTPEQQEKKEAK